MNSTTRNVLAVLTVLLLSGGIALAIVQPGNLGDESASATTTSSSTTATGPTVTETPTTETPTTETPTTETPTTETPTTDTTATTQAPPTTSGGGLAGSGGADAGGNNIANTGGESALFLLGAALLAGLGLVARRLSRLAG